MSFSTVLSLLVTSVVVEYILTRREYFQKSHYFFQPGIETLPWRTTETSRCASTTLTRCKPRKTCFFAAKKLECFDKHYFHPSLFLAWLNVDRKVLKMFVGFTAVALTIGAPYDILCYPQVDPPNNLTWVDANEFNS